MKKSKSKNKEINKIINPIYISDVIYCIVTYYPLFDTFIQIIANFINTLKIIRTKEYIKIVEQYGENSKKIK